MRRAVTPVTAPDRHPPIHDARGFSEEEDMKSTMLARSTAAAAAAAGLLLAVGSPATAANYAYMGLLRSLVRAERDLRAGGLLLQDGTSPARSSAPAASRPTASSASGSRTRSARFSTGKTARAAESARGTGSSLVNGGRGTACSAVEGAREGALLHRHRLRVEHRPVLPEIEVDHPPSGAPRRS